MKTITISVDDETYRRCCARAETAGQPVAEMVGRWLTDWTGKPAVPDAEQECRQEKMLQVLADVHAAAKARWDGSPRPEKLTRDELHDRNALR